MNLTSENPIAIQPNAKLSFTYSVHWKPTTKPFSQRFNRYLEYDFFEHQIHWFSIFNSFMMVIFLCGLVSLILLRTLRNDFAKFAKDEEMDIEGTRGLGDDSGWKQVHGDVFRAPSNLILFTALWGTGWQLIVLFLGVILYAMAGTTFLACRINYSQGPCTDICMKIVVKWLQPSLFVLHCHLQLLDLHQDLSIECILPQVVLISILNGKKQWLQPVCFSLLLLYKPLQF